MARPAERAADRGRPRGVRAARPAGRAVRERRAVGAAAAAGRVGRGRPARRGPRRGRHAYYWTVREFVRERLPAVHVRRGGGRALARSPTWSRASSPTWTASARTTRTHEATVVLDGVAGPGLRRPVRRDQGERRGRRLAVARPRCPTRPSRAFVRRLDAARFRLIADHLIWGREAEDPRRHRIDWEPNQVTVVDIHNLHDRAKRFVTGVVVKRLFEHKERMGRREPLAFLVLDELNRYAPREGWTPDQGGPAGRRRTRPLARDDPDRRRADRVARSSAA